MDARLRHLYRAVFADPHDARARRRVERELRRLGWFHLLYPSLAEEEDPDPLEDVEEDLRLHPRPRPEPMGCGCAWCLGKNAKKKTLRTHRNPKARRGRLSSKFLRAR